jgi:hypothetical protein
MIFKKNYSHQNFSALIFHLYKSVLVIAISLLATLSAQAEILVEPADTESGSISSSNAAYDGNDLILTGKVSLDHGLGRMEAAKAVLQRQETSKEFPFTFIHLDQNVLIVLKDKSVLQCDKADLDFKALYGVLTAHKQLNYKDTLTFSNKPVDVEIRSQNAKLQFFRGSDQDEESKVLFGIETIAAEHNVEVIVSNREKPPFTLLAESVLYCKPIKEIDSKEVKPYLRATPGDSQTCSILYEKDRIDAASIEVDLAQSILHLQKPEGRIGNLFLGSKEEALQFQANVLKWDQIRERMYLTGPIEIIDPSMGRITNQDQIILEKKQNALRSLQATGETIVLSTASQKLICYGSLKINRSLLNAYADSPLIEDKVPLGKQVYYEESQMAIVSNKIYINYASHQNFSPVSLSLTGNVKIFSTDITRPLKKGIADQATYLPNSRTLVLSAESGKKVMYVDEEDKTEICAQEVHITEDPVTHKQSIKGIGNVVLKLTVEQQKIMEQLFNSPS